jgi:hypothetical protein
MFLLTSPVSPAQTLEVLYAWPTGEPQASLVRASDGAFYGVAGIVGIRESQLGTGAVSLVHLPVGLANWNS